MKLLGTYQKDGNFWLSEIDLIDFMDQGKSKKECLANVASAIELLADGKFKVILEDKGSGQFFISADNTRAFLAFILKRIRESEGLTIREAASRLGMKHHNSYARHESGKNPMSADTFDSYIKGISRKDFVLQPVY